jgi:uroporphyrinogen decarboxylase
MKQGAGISLFPERKPDFERLRRAIYRDGVPDCVPFVELFADREIVAAVLGEEPYYRANDRAEKEAELLQRIRFCETVGFDFVWCYPGVNFHYEGGVAFGKDTADLSRPARSWINETQSVIASMEDFDKHPWPTPESVDYSDLEFVAAHLPEGMKIIATTTGVMEIVMWLMSFTIFSIKLYDEPELIEAMFNRVVSILAPIYDNLAAHPEVGAVFLGDDMGHKSGTFIRPDHMRQYIFPRQRQLVEIAHSYGKPFLLHACGNLADIMDDLIDYVGIDGKHSYEDTYLPVTEAKRLYGDKIAILGGVDVDMLCRTSEEEVRTYTRRVLEECMPGGGYALGTGNSVANYIPVQNYLAMLDEGARFGKYD